MNDTAPFKVVPSQIDAIFAEWNRTDSPGCAVAVMHRGRIIYERGYGMADLSHDAIITPTTPFHVASVSKQFTSAAILLLADQGKLSLDDNIRSYLPELHEFGPVITVRHLLHHTSGIRDQWDLLNLAGYRYSLDLITDDDVMSLVTRQRELNFPPGSEYLYSNAGSTLLGQIVRRVSGESLRAFTTRHVFEPLGMKDTHFRDDHAEINKGEALGYERSKDGQFRLSVTNFDTVGATSLYTTVRDMAKWDEHFYAPKIGGAGFDQKMLQTTRLTTGQDNSYAMGLMLLQYRGLATVEHAGADAGYRASFLRFPAQQFSVIVLFNTVANAVGLARKLADLFLASSFPQPAAAPFSVEACAALPAQSIRGKEGFYRSRGTGMLLRLGWSEGRLCTLSAQEQKPLLSDGRGHFLLPGQVDRAHFEAAEDQAQRLVIQGEGKLADIWDRLPAFTLEVSAHKDFVGLFYSEELDTHFSIEHRDGKLVLVRKKYPADELVPVAADLFASSCGSLRFTRDSNGTVSGILLTTGRIRNLKFVRQNRA